MTTYEDIIAFQVEHMGFTHDAGEYKSFRSFETYNQHCIENNIFGISKEKFFQHLSETLDVDLLFDSDVKPLDVADEVGLTRDEVVVVLQTSIIANFPKYTNEVMEYI